jgi:DNA-binding transcriptional LysR family regulator
MQASPVQLLSIGQLEEYLGRALLFREPGILRLMVAGERYADRARMLLEECSDAK